MIDNNNYQHQQVDLSNYSLSRNKYQVQPSKANWIETNQGDFVLLKSIRTQIDVNQAKDPSNKVDQPNQPSISNALSISQSNRIKVFQKPKVLSGQVVFSKSQGYVKLVQKINNQNPSKIEGVPDSHNALNSQTGWTFLPNSQQQNQSQNEQQLKLNGLGNQLVYKDEIMFQIKLEVVSLIDKKVSQNLMKVNFMDKIQSLIDLNQKFTSSKVIAIYQGRQLDLQKTFIDENIPNLAKIMLTGLVEMEEVIFQSEHSQLRKFRRFSDVRNGDSWYIGRERWDALVFQPNQNVRVYGIGLFEPFPNGTSFQLGYKYHVEDHEGNNLFSSEMIEEQVNCPLPNEPLSEENQSILDIESHIIWYKFQSISQSQGITVRANQRFNVQTWMSGDRCYYSETGEGYANIQLNEDMGLFRISDSQYCSNSTRVNRGILPGILYTIQA